MENLKLNLIQNREFEDKCAFCGNHKAEVPLTDGETLREIHICKECDWLLGIVESTQDTDNF